MSKPQSNSESHYKYWLDENPESKSDKFDKWAKKQINRAKRRQGKLKSSEQDYESR